MKYTFIPENVCARKIDFAIEEGIIGDIYFEGGCHGNLQGIAKLARGRNAQEIAGLLCGIKCNDQATSCPDQLARAIREACRPPVSE